MRRSGVTSAIAREMKRDAVTLPEAGSRHRIGGPIRARRTSASGASPPCRASASRSSARRSRFSSLRSGAKDREQELALRAEIIADRGEVHLGRLDDVAHRHAVEAALGEQLFRGQEDALARVGRGVCRRRLGASLRPSMRRSLSSEARPAVRRAPRVPGNFCRQDAGPRTVSSASRRIGAVEDIGIALELGRLAGERDRSRPADRAVHRWRAEPERNNTGGQSVAHNPSRNAARRSALLNAFMVARPFAGRLGASDDSRFRIEVKRSFYSWPAVLAAPAGTRGRNASASASRLGPAPVRFGFVSVATGVSHGFAGVGYG